MSKTWWKRPVLALTRYALAQPGVRERAGTASLFKSLCGLYEQWKLDPALHKEHGFVKPPIPGVAGFMIDDGRITVRNKQGRMKALHPYSMRAYVEAARKGLRPGA